MTPRLYLGTIGLSVWYSDDLGENLGRYLSDAGLYSESRVWSLSHHPKLPGETLAGTDSGIYRLDRARAHWTHVPSPMDDRCVWSVAHSPHNPDIVLAGTRPPGLFRSENGGQTWRRIAAPLPETCRAVLLPRVTQIVFDPKDSSLVWAGLEIGGVWRSRDAGVSWESASQGLVSDDIHGLAVVYNGARKLFATTNTGAHLSADDGNNWEFRELDSPWQYTRSIVPRADRRGTMFMTNGDGPPGSTGRLWRSRDFGVRWEDAKLPGKIESTPWCIATIGLHLGLALFMGLVFFSSLMILLTSCLFLIPEEA